MYTINREKIKNNDRNCVKVDSIIENNINLKDMEINVIGQGNYIQQQLPDTCAIKSQQIILNEFGVPATEQQLVDWSIENGLYDGNGTSPIDVGKALVAGGVPCTQKVDANMFDLTNELAQGHKVIIGVDSGELWNKGLVEWWEDLFGDGEVADHALIVAGIDNSDPNNIQVILTDPGTGDLCKSYPLDQFMDAWQDSGCFMVSTDVAPSEFASTQIVNNQPAMYLPEVGNQSYQDFQLYHDIADSFPSFVDWNYDLADYPMSSLFDAYQSGMGAQELINSDIWKFVDGDAFASSYSDTFDFGLRNVADTEAIQVLDSFVADNQNLDVVSLQDRFEELMSDYADTDTADFFSQQMDFIECYQSFGLDPVSFYQNYDFSGII